MQHTLLAIQVFLGLPEATPLHGHLLQLLHQAPESAHFNQKNNYYRAVAHAMRPFTMQFIRGVWDYVEDPAKAQFEWQDWIQGTMRDAAAPRDDQGPYRGGRSYMFMTMLVLMRKGSVSDRTVCELCRMPEEQMWQRQTMMRIIDGASQLNFSQVRGDALYLRPGLSTGSVTEEELGEEHYEYLNQLV